MNIKIFALKMVAVCLILTLMFLIGYANLTISWGLEVKSWVGFFGFFILSMIMQTILQAILSIKEE
jgi:hypothetical protein